MQGTLSLSATSAPTDRRVTAVRKRPIFFHLAADTLYPVRDVAACSARTVDTLCAADEQAMN